MVAGKIENQRIPLGPKNQSHLSSASAFEESPMEAADAGAAMQMRSAP